MPEVPATLLSDIQYGFDALITRRAMRVDAGTVPTHNARHLTDSAARSELTAVRVGVAQIPGQFAAAAMLVRQRYSWRGYEVGSSGEERDPSASDRSVHEITFVAEDDRTTFGTITLGLDGPSGLRADSTHGDAVVAMRADGRQVCEVTRLAVMTNPISRNVLAALFSLAYTAAHIVHGASDMFIEVNPRHVSFYSRLLGFVVAASERFCERVRAPSVLLHLELDALEERLQMLSLRAISEPMLAAAA
jgi:hypothetical protein